LVVAFVIAGLGLFVLVQFDFSSKSAIPGVFVLHEPLFLAFYLVVNERDHGFWVEEADGGTIESTIPPG
jgi:hypothetical protein